MCRDLCSMGLLDTIRYRWNYLCYQTFLILIRMLSDSTWNIFCFQAPWYDAHSLITVLSLLDSPTTNPLPRLMTSYISLLSRYLIPLVWMEVIPKPANEFSSYIYFSQMYMPNFPSCCSLSLAYLTKFLKPLFQHSII